jgi:hypothetical protein
LAGFQVIAEVVTHNANIAVLGDAEQIVVLRASNEQGVIVSRGSIDDPGTREAACALLEGSREAFQRRARIYGGIVARSGVPTVYRAGG